MTEMEKKLFPQNIVYGSIKMWPSAKFSQTFEELSGQSINSKKKVGKVLLVQLKNLIVLLIFLPQTLIRFKWRSKKVQKTLKYLF